MFLNYLKIALRNIRNDRSGSIINITGLSIGMSVAILIFLWVQNEINFDNYHANAGRIYSVRLAKKTDAIPFSGTPVLLAEAIQKQVPDIEKVTEVIGNNFPRILNIKENYFKEKGWAYADKEWFSLFNYEFTDGTAEGFNETPGNIILTASLAKKYFGSARAVGEIIKIDSIPYTVKGVISDPPINSSFQYTFFLPIEEFMKQPGVQQQGWMYLNAETFILLKENANEPGVEKGINSIVAHHDQLQTLLSNGARRDTLMAGLTALEKLHFTASQGQSKGIFSGGKGVVYIFSLLGLLLLAVACINYVNLTTARASMRSKEVSIKKMMGAGIRELFLQFITESAVTSMIALLLTLVIVRLALPWFNGLAGKTFTLSFFSAALWKVCGITLITTVLLTGIYPALLLSSFKPLNVLRGINFLKIKSPLLRQILVSVQFTIAIALSVAAIIILKQLYFMQSNNEGYDRRQIFSFTVPGSWASNNMATDKTETFALLKAGLQKETAILHVTVSNDDIQNLQMAMNGVADWAGKKKGQDPLITMLTTDACFRDIFKLQLKKGRWFQENNAADHHNYILTENTVTALGLKQPLIGQYFSMMGDTGQVIGIVKDFHFNSYHQTMGNAVLMNNPLYAGSFFVEAAPNKIGAALAKASSTFKTFFPHTPFEYKFMDATFEQMYRADKKTATLVASFSGIAIFISCLGLFGLISFVAEQRTKEIGIRKILGATVINIAALLSKDFIKLVLIAIGIAAPVAWWAMNIWLESFAYRISISAWIFILSGGAAILLTCITISVHAIKAATANPAKRLRTE